MLDCFLIVIWATYLGRLLKIQLEENSIVAGCVCGDAYYQNTIGVTVLAEEHIQDIVLKIDRSNAPYVITKPFHHSQELIERHQDGAISIKLRVHMNFELERLILGFAETIEVLHPRRLRSRIKKKLRNAAAVYDV